MSRDRGRRAEILSESPVTQYKVPKLSWSGVSARRLERHGLAEPFADASPSEVVGAMCAAHAQIMSAAELSVGIRTSNVTRQTVRDALWKDRTLVKTFGPRGTVHLLPAEELPMWTGALSSVPRSIGQTKDVRMTPEQTEEIIAAVRDALRDAELTADELTGEVVRRAGPWAGDPVMPAFGGMWPRWRQAMDEAANRGALCFGPNRGRRVTYTSPERWLPDFEPMPRGEALSRLVRRYLHAFGPATPEHFARWLAAPERWTRGLFDSLSDELQRVEVEGNEAWVWAGDVESPSDALQGLRLLPYFDAYVVGGQPREKLYPGRAAERALSPLGQAGNFPVLLIDGEVAGVWHQRRSGKRIEVTVEPLEPLTSGHVRDLDRQTERVGEILEGRVSLTIGEVTVGPHA